MGEAVEHCNPKIHIGREVVALGEHMREIESIYGSARAAAKAAGIDPGYWVRLRSGEKKNPSRKVLESLGLKVHTVTFYTKPKFGVKP